MSQSLFMTNLVALKTIVRREVRRFFRIWPQTLLPACITTALYFVIFGRLMGERIGAMDGVPYMTYIVPGLILMSVITNSYGNVVSSFFSTKFHRSIEELLVAPVSAHVIIGGFVLGGICRGCSVALLVFLLSWVFVGCSVQHAGVTALVAVLVAAVFSLAGFINAVFARNFDDISIIPTFVLTPLTYLGGVFYSIHLLPNFWQTLSLLNPVVHMVNAFRYGVLGISDISIEMAITFMAVVVGCLYGWALFLLNTGRGLRQ